MGAKENQMIGIPVLMYHHVNPVGSFINVKPTNFDRQMKFLKNLGYQTINTRDYLEIIKEKIKIPKKTVMITFDDGWLDNWLYAYPILKKYGLKAVIFITTSLITQNKKRSLDNNNLLFDHKDCLEKIKTGKSSEIMLSWDEIEEMENSGIIDIQSHSHTHQRWDKIFNNLEELKEFIFNDLKTSKDTIEKRLNKICHALCWPWGIYDENYINLAKEVGFNLCFTTEKGTNPINVDLYRIKRIAIGDIGTFNFMKKLFIYSNESTANFYLKYLKK